MHPSTLDLKKLKSRPHVDGIVGSSQRKVIDIWSLIRCNSCLSTNCGWSGPWIDHPTTHSSDVHTVQSKTQKGPQQPEDKKKGKGKKGSGGKDKKANKMLRGKRMKRER
jgi:hypothetical protein